MIIFNYIIEQERMSAMSNIDFYDDNITVQWVNDVKYMSPSPHPNHGIVYSNIFNQLFNYLKGKKCKVFPDKVDLILSNPDGTINIRDLKKPVVPDLFVVCDNRFELISNNIIAIPDFICEIISPSSIKMDTIIKKDLYLSKGVKEYWIVNYFEKTITTCFDNKECEYSFDDTVKVNIFDDLSICLKDVELLEI
jgi:Uma2 family endonuclease